MSDFVNIFKVPELRKRLLFTGLILIVYRIGAHIPTPGIDAAALGDIFAKAGGTLFGFFDLFSGGALRRASIFALGIMPYIDASIILQLLAVVVPYIERLQKEGAEGRKKITKYTRYWTVLIDVLHWFCIAIVPEGIIA
jgi:preprotein translocase subunit SecY